MLVFQGRWSCTLLRLHAQEVVIRGQQLLASRGLGPDDELSALFEELQSCVAEAVAMDAEDAA